jgi:DNA anti-recombination protein RmuC
MEIKETIIEAIKSVIIPELDEIKKDIAVINARLDGIDKRFEDLRTDMNKRFEDLRTDMNKRFEDLRTDMNKRFEDLRTDMNKRFEEHYNFNMKRFDSIELQIYNILAEIRDMRRLYEKKVDVDEFRRLENNYLELLKEVAALRQRVVAA